MALLIELFPNVTPNKDIFCNAPWYELQIYWDGSLGFCCQESHKLYSESEAGKYNLKSMTIEQWFNSDLMQQARQSMLGHNKNSFCTRCYNEEQYSASSRRHRSNQKSVIFTKENFEESFQQSPHFSKFTNNHSIDITLMPLDLHIDLGNYCNLTCKMCNPRASSSIAAQYVKWNIAQPGTNVGIDWTRDDEVWQRTLTEIVAMSNIKNIHFMGGETLLTKKFEEFVDRFIEEKRYDVGFSFVSNGTVFNEQLLKKLKKFRRVGIEISIESVTAHNAYQRQGTDTEMVLSHIDKYIESCNGTSITVTVRPAISALTIGYFHSLLEYCLHKKLLVKSNIAANPRYFNPVILPDTVKQLYLTRYHEFIDKHYSTKHIDIDQDFNESDPNQIPKIIYQQAQQCIQMLKTPTPLDQSQQLKHMVHWCRQWDQVHGYDARQLYPEFSDILTLYEY